MQIKTLSVLKALSLLLLTIPFQLLAGPIGNADKIALCKLHYAINDLYTALHWCEYAQDANMEESKEYLLNIHKKLSNPGFTLNFDDHEVLHKLCIHHLAIQPGPNRWCMISGKLGNTFAIDTVENFHGSGYIESLDYEWLISIDPKRNAP